MQGQQPEMAILAFADIACHLDVIQLPDITLVYTSHFVELPADFQDCHDFYEFLIPLSDIPGFFAGDTTINCQPGHVIPINRGLVHGSRSVQKPVSFFLVQVRSAVMEDIIGQITGDSTSKGLPAEPFPLDNHIRSLISRMMTEAREHQAGRDPLIRCLAEELAILLFRNCSVPGLRPGLAAPYELSGEQLRFQRVIAYMQEHFDKRLSVAGLAEMVGMSNCYFIHSFKKYFDISPYNYLTRIRIAHARHLLTDTVIPTIHIGRQSGFSSASRFAAAFQKDTGMKPSQFRKAYRF